MERAVEIAVLVLVAWPAARLLAAPALHRRLAAHPGRLLIVVGGATAYLGGVALLALGPLWLLRAAILVALAAIVAAWWHARPAYGRGRGLPPGSLAFTQLGLVTDERFLLEQARRHGPVFKIARYGRPIACVVGIARGAELLRRADADLVSGPLPFNALIPGGFLRYMARRITPAIGRWWRRRCRTSWCARPPRCSPRPPPGAPSRPWRTRVDHLPRRGSHRRPTCGD